MPTVLVKCKPFQQIRKISQVLFGKYLLLTNISVSMGLSGSGDILQQYYDNLRKTIKTHETVNSWNKQRTSNMVISAIPIGALCHYWYLYLDNRLPGRTLKIVLKKVVVDQIIFSPVMFAVFFFTMGILEKSSYAKVKQEMIQKGAQLYIADCIVWPPAQVFNFYFLPTRFRVLYDNTISLGFDIYTSYVKYKVELKECI